MMARMSERKQSEIAHGRKIAGKAVEVWNWHTASGRRRADRRAHFLSSGFLAGDRVLEIGAGTGEFTRRLSGQGLKLVACDLSFDLLRQISAPVPKVVADAEHLPFRTGAFQGAIGSSILHHLDVKASISELLRVLAPGGQFRFAEPNLLNPQIFLQKTIPALKRAMGDTPHETAFLRKRLDRELSGLGATELRVSPYDFLHPLVPGPLVIAVERAGRLMERTPLLREIAGSLQISGRKPLKPGAR